MNTGNLKAIKEGVEPCRQALKTTCFNQLQSRAKKVEELLIQHNWDLESAYPRNSYCWEARNEAQEYVTRSPDAPCVRRPGDPNIVIIRPDLEERHEKEAEQLADNFLESYSLKIAGKVEETDPDFVIIKAEYVGAVDPFSNSQFILTNQNGDKMIWNTKCILNVSKHGKLFNQWPTRLQKTKN